ncbi:MAG: deoxyguanosinetriphosphate triphosphohydrolase [Bermanella sp.]
MDWKTLLNAKRFGEHESAELGESRTPFHKDHDRVIFSSSFRRLERKTQVHPLSDNDHIHSRLTHSLEVSCVGRSLGAQVGEMLGDRLPAGLSPADLGAIVQAACLAHDIGNPPFGHTGEDAIRHWFRDSKNAAFLSGLSTEQVKDFQTFEGNAQGLRILTQLEYHRFDGGMRLTYATLGSFLKYPWHSGYQDPLKGEKFGVYQSELAFLNEIAQEVGLIKIEQNRYCRHPLVYLMEAADDICYAIIDLEDGVEMNLLQYTEVESLLLGLIGEDVPSSYFKTTSEDPARRRLAILRGKAIEIMVNAVADAFIEQEQALLSGQLSGDPIALTNPKVADCIAQAKNMAREKIFKDPKKALIEIGAYTTLGSLLESFLTAVDEVLAGDGVSYKSQRILDLIGRHAPQAGWDKYRSYLRVVDYIAGMTDAYAVELAQAIRGLRL